MKKKIDYTGDKRFRVYHSQHGNTVVSAPDEASAIFAAGYEWGVDPTRIDFYAYCAVSKAPSASGHKKRAASAATLTTHSELSAAEAAKNNNSIARDSKFRKG